MPSFFEKRHGESYGKECEWRGKELEALIQSYWNFYIRYLNKAHLNWIRSFYNYNLDSDYLQWKKKALKFPLMLSEDNNFALTDILILIFSFNYK